MNITDDYIKKKFFIKRNTAKTDNAKLLEIYDRDVTKDKLSADIMEYCNGNI